MMERARQFSEGQYISLETYRRTGAPVRTTVWLVEDGGTIYVRTGPNSGKVKRIRHNPHVRLARTSLRGNIQGEWADGRARFLGEEESGRLMALFRRKYGLQMRLVGWIARVKRAKVVRQVFLAIDLA